MTLPRRVFLLAALAGSVWSHAAFAQGTAASAAGEGSIRILVPAEAGGDGPEIVPETGGISERLREATQALASRSVIISTEVLSKNLLQQMSQLIDAMPTVPGPLRHFEVSEVSFVLNVDAKGGVSLVASGEVGLSAGIRVTLKRSNGGKAIASAK